MKTEGEINVRKILKLEQGSYICTFSSLQNILYYSKYYLTSDSDVTGDNLTV